MCHELSKALCKCREFVAPGVEGCELPKARREGREFVVIASECSECHELPEALREGHKPVEKGG